jgi:glycine/D-amino acid oxidase-like deaminating enzyme
MPLHPDIVVVGGGIVGCACACELAAAGLHVMLLERRGLAAGASGRNQGLLQPNPDPLYHLLFQEAVRRYERLAQEGGTPLNLRSTPQLVLADEATLPAMKRVAGLFAAAGITVEPLEPDELTIVEPCLAVGLAGGFRLPGVRTLDPTAATVAFAEAGRRAGAVVRTRTEVRMLLRSGDRVIGVLTDLGTVPAAAVLVAAGPDTGKLLATAHVHVPVASARGWLLQTAPLPWKMAHVLGEAEWQNIDIRAFGRLPTMRELAGGVPDTGDIGVAFTLQQALEGGHATIGATAASAICEGPNGPQAAVHLLAARALQFVPGLAGVSVTRVWSGVRSVTSHGAPVIGKAHGVEGLWIAAGHGSQGVMLAPATARMLTEYLIDGRAHGADVFDLTHVME